MKHSQKWRETSNPSIPTVFRTTSRCRENNITWSSKYNRSFEKGVFEKWAYFQSGDPKKNLKVNGCSREPKTTISGLFRHFEKEKLFWNLSIFRFLVDIFVMSFSKLLVISVEIHFIIGLSSNFGKLPKTMKIAGKESQDVSQHFCEGMN